MNQTREMIFVNGRIFTSNPDQPYADVPVIVTRTCAHIAVVNSLALELAGINKDTPNPPGGKIDKDANGEPTAKIEITIIDGKIQTI